MDLDGYIDQGLPEIPNRMLYVHYPIFDESLPCWTSWKRWGGWWPTSWPAGTRWLVHCRMGFNRSNLVVATALTYLGLSGAEAVTHLQKVRPGALYNETFAEHVRALPAGRAPRRLGHGGRGTGQDLLHSGRRRGAPGVDAGASALGLVSEMPSGPGVIDEETIAGRAAAAPPGWHLPPHLPSRCPAHRRAGAAHAREHGADL